MLAWQLFRLNILQMSQILRWLLASWQSFSILAYMRSYYFSFRFRSSFSRIYLSYSYLSICRRRIIFSLPYCFSLRMFSCSKSIILFIYYCSIECRTTIYCLRLVDDYRLNFRTSWRIFFRMLCSFRLVSSLRVGCGTCRSMLGLNLLLLLQPSIYNLAMEDQNNPMKRSKLSNVTFIKWIRSRFNNQKRPNNKYLYFPQELVKETSIEKIFIQFDSDGSGGLSRQQVYDMFNSFGINITMYDLNDLYDSVQVNLQELDCNMFKKCALSQQSNQVFRKIVAKLGSGYFPHNFTNMIIYIVFLSKREQLRNTLMTNTEKIDNKVANMEKILKLNDLALNNQRLAAHTEHFKHNIRNNLRDIWEKINEKYGQKFPFTPKIQQEFYEFCLKTCITK